MTIKNFIKLPTLLFMVLLFSFLTACGGGGGDDPIPQQAVFTLSVNGGDETIGAVDALITLPAGFTLPVDGSNNLTTTTLASRLPADTIFEYNYTAPTATIAGSLQIGIIQAETGFTQGELLRIVRPLNGQDTLPDVSSFEVTLTAADLDGVELSVMTEQVSVTQEPVP